MSEKKAGKSASSLTLLELLGGGEDPYHAVELPGILKGGRPGVVYLRQLSAAEALDFGAQSGKATAEAKKLPEEEQEAAIQRASADSMADMISKTLVDETGELLFKPGDIASVQKLPMSVLSRIMQEASSMAGLGRKEDLGKGSPETPTSASPTA